MKALIILADGTRYADQEVDDTALNRGYVEFSREPSENIEMAGSEQVQPPLHRSRKYAVCLHDGNENGVPVFIERRRSAPPAQKK